MFSSRPFLSSVGYFLICFFLFASLAGVEKAIAQSPEETVSTASVARLQALQQTLEELQKSQRNLAQKIQQATDEDKAALEEEKATIDQEVKRVNQSFERLATGGVETELFGAKEPEFNWQTEIIQIMQPLIENLKVLTEKPRKIERLRSTIAQRQDYATTIDNALASLSLYAGQELPEATEEKVQSLVERWQRRKEDNKNSLEIATLQLQDLQGETVSWMEVIKRSVDEFFLGRGLTLLIAFGAALGVWLFMRSLLWLLSKRVKNSAERRTLTRYRLAAYAYSLLTTLLVIIAVMVVFYSRGDVLLLGLAILLVAAIIIGLRNTLPRFIAETKLLLNLGAAREGERIMYNGIPWKLSSINLYSVLRNPEIDGTIRLPLSELGSMTSRPVGHEPWFPHRRGDFVMLPNGKLAEIIRQTPDNVELKLGGGAAMFVPTADMFNMDVLNLTRNGCFGVAGIFGIDYSHQTIALTDVGPLFKAEIETALRSTDFFAAVKNILVELKAAGASSLDYLVYITFDSSAAQSFYSIERLIQQSCIKVCNEQNWTIPFPQLTVHTQTEPAPSPARE
ncbi:MAG: hypothetical protein KDJ38_11385 [Gammaproteobacteria bacterium]|nr:hypothetical protein [Gammaproteobacteria bacterium]